MVQCRRDRHRPATQQPCKTRGRGQRQRLQKRPPPPISEGLTSTDIEGQAGQHLPLIGEQDCLSARRHIALAGTGSPAIQVGERCLRCLLPGGSNAHCMPMWHYPSWQGICQVPNDQDSRRRYASRTEVGTAQQARQDQASSRAVLAHTAHPEVPHKGSLACPHTNSSTLIVHRLLYASRRFYRSSSASVHGCCYRRKNQNTRRRPTMMITNQTHQGMRPGSIASIAVLIVTAPFCGT